MVTDFRNQVIAPHQGLLVVAGLGLDVGGVRERVLRASPHTRDRYAADVRAVVRERAEAGAARGDQQRVAAPADALRAGASHLVVARPIVAADNPLRAASAIVEEIDGVVRAA